jgi:hypothetical protein
MSSDVPAQSPPTDLVFPRPGIPLWGEQVDERSHRLAAGDSTEVISSTVYRDSVGRLRIDSVRQCGLERATLSYIVDPTEVSRTVLLSDLKLAYRAAVPGPGSSAVLGLHGIGAGVSPVHNWITVQEDLGSKTIDGIEYEGSRIRQTAQDGSGLTNTVEQWLSRKLQLVGMATATGPYGTHRAKILNVHLGEPDPLLFSVPPDYNVVDVGVTQ